MSDAFEVTPPVDLPTTRLLLRALSPKDSPGIYGYASDPEVARFTLWRPHDSEAFTRGFIKFFTGPQFLNWAIVEPPDREAIGMVFLHSFNQQHRKAEIAFNLARSHWNRGLATEAAKAVLHFAFQWLNLNRVEATCMPENIGSRRVLEKIGMTHEGRMRKSHHRHDGFHDMDLFAILAPAADGAQSR